jgi:hypothetical protein
MLRERQEDRIFRALLKLCHGLEDRLADAEPEEVQLIGDLVCAIYVILSKMHHPLVYRFRRASTLLELMTQRE